MIVGPALGGIIAAAFGPPTAFALTTVGFVAPITALWRNNWKVKPRSGPILITTGYSIPQEHVDRFLDIMRERRHVQRSRVGARQWTLTSDVQDPSRWL